MERKIPRTHKLNDSEKKGLMVLIYEGKSNSEIIKLFLMRGITLAQSTISAYRKKANLESVIGHRKLIYDELARIFSNKLFWKFFDLCFFEPIQMKEAAKKLNLDLSSLNSKIHTINRSGFIILKKFEITKEFHFSELGSGDKANKRFLYLDFTPLFYHLNYTDELDSFEEETFGSRMRLINCPFFRINLYNSVEYADRFGAFRKPIYKRKGFQDTYLFSNLDMMSVNEKQTMLLRYLTFDYNSKTLFEWCGKLGVGKNTDYFPLPSLFKGKKKTIIDYLVGFTKFKLFYYEKDSEGQKAMQNDFVKCAFDYFFECAQKKEKFREGLKKAFL